MKVVWAASALDDFDRMIAYYASRNPAAAARIANAIDSAAIGLGKLQTGRRGRIPGCYEKPVGGSPYVLAYAIASTPDAQKTVVILRVVHGARDWPPGQWPR
jgi:plasmid stabilization system protein ParE